MRILDLALEKYIVVQSRALRRLRALGIITVRDLLYHFPRRYEDYSTIHPISTLKKGESVTIQGTIKTIDGRHAWGRRGMTIIEATIKDSSGTILAVWFNQYYLLKILKPGMAISLSGKVGLGKKGLYLQHPEHEKIHNLELLRHTGRLVPIYPETYGMTSRWLRFLIQQALEKLPPKIPDIIPAEIRKQHELRDFQNAIHEIHFPRTESEAEQAKCRFRFEELFLLQLKKYRAILELKKKSAPSIPVDQSYWITLLKSLPFSLTQAQEKVLHEILHDLQQPHPMNRLLNGDVGSGKTLVAALAALAAVRQGFQVAFMAPTELLARQHFETFLKFFKSEDVAYGLTTSSEKRIETPFGASLKADIAKMARAGDLNIIIGTHALISAKSEYPARGEQNGISFKNLGLVIVDEQHRFGVAQRAKLLQKNNSEFRILNSELIPHFLSMTATPIPRTLALTVYGDLEISVIDELPPGRKKVITKIVRPSRREAAYKFVEEEMRKGRQAFVICPRIEESESPEERALHSLAALVAEEMKSVKKEFKKLSEKIFPHRKIAMLHGKMKPKEKTVIMEAFRNHAYDILVATSVIEVGVDIPNASIMMIESAERFGLASLHQFRGRVGRSEYQSYCLLFPSSESCEWNERLKAIATSTNGFELAEKDLRLRGPGNLLGLEQSGFHIPLQESLMDMTLVETTAKAAQKIMAIDPELKKYPLLAERLSRLQYILHAE